MFKGLRKAFDKFDQQSFTAEKSGKSVNLLLLEESINLLLPEDVILIILSFLPKIDINACSQVCRQWRFILTSVAFWKLKCSRDIRFIPPINNKWTPKYEFYKSIYYKNPYARNLIRNPCGEDNMEHWEIIESGGDNWIVEKEPFYCDPFNIFADTHNSFTSSCFATSFSLCSRYQLIDLAKEGCDYDYIDILQPGIKVSEWHAARGDCGSFFELKVELLGKNATSQIKEFKPERVQVEQWLGGSWSKLEHTFQNYGPGVRYIKFSDAGQDSQFWAGNYGSKMSGALVQFVFPE